MHLYTPMPASCSDLQAVWIVPIFNSTKKISTSIPAVISGHAQSPQSVTL